MSETDELPDYAFLWGTALRRDGARFYYRDAGGWGVPVDDEGTVVARGIDPRLEGAIGFRLVPTSREVWFDDNRGYAGDNTAPVREDPEWPLAPGIAF